MLKCADESPKTLIVFLLRESNINKYELRAPHQLAVIVNLCCLLVPGGFYLMCSTLIVIGPSMPVRAVHLVSICGDGDGQ